MVYLEVWKRMTYRSEGARPPRELTKSEKVSLSTTEIAKRIRRQLKTEFKGCKFSVRTKYYSMGSSITVSLMVADRKIKKDYDDISEIALLRSKDNHYTPDQLKALQGEKYHQLNEYTLRREYDPDYWCNGVFLTKQGHILLKRVVQIADYYNYNDSDSMTDYYSVNYSFSLQLGRYDRPFIDGIDSKSDPDLESRVSARVSEVEANTRKMKEEEAYKTKIERLESESHVAKSMRTVRKIKDLLRSTAIIGENGFEVLTPEVRTKKILEIDEVKQALKVKGIDWTQEILDL